MSVRMKNKVKISLKNIFSGDCRDGCMQNQGCENENTPNVLQRIQYTLYW